MPNPLWWIDGAKLRACRKACGLRRAELAAQAGISLASLQRMETTGGRWQPWLTNVTAVATVLEVAAIDLITGNRCQWPSGSHRWWPVEVPTRGHEKSPPVASRDGDAHQVVLGATPPPRVRASRMRNDSPAVTTIVAWCSRRSSKEAAVVASGRKRPHWSKGQ